MSIRSRGADARSLDLSRAYMTLDAIATLTGMELASVRAYARPHAVLSSAHYNNGRVWLDDPRVTGMIAARMTRRRPRESASAAQLAFMLPLAELAHITPRPDRTDRLAARVGADRLCDGRAAATDPALSQRRPRVAAR